MSSMQQQHQNTDEHHSQDNNNDFITEVGPDDVLLGRGNHAYNRGNEKFRQIVQSRSLEYWSYKDNTSRDNVVRQIIEMIHSRQGRFLRKVTHTATTDGTASTNANPPPSSDISNTATAAQWEIAETATIMVKIKQTLRDMTASMRKRAASSSSVSQQQQSHPQQQQQEGRTMISSNCQSSIMASNLPKPIPSSDDQSILLDRMASITGSCSARNDPDNDRMFQSARLAQLGYLLQSNQQRQEQQNVQDQQLMILLEQQRYNLVEQWQQQQQQSTLSQSHSCSHQQPQSTMPQHQQQQQQQHLSSNFSPPIQGEMTYHSSTAEYPSHPNIPSQTSDQIAPMHLIKQYRTLHQCDQGIVNRIPQQQQQQYPMPRPSLSSHYPGTNNSELASLDVVSQNWPAGQQYLPQQQQQPLAVQQQHLPQQQQQPFALQQQFLMQQQPFAVQQQFLMQQQQQQHERGRLLTDHNECIAMHANQEVPTNQIIQSSSLTAALNAPNTLSNSTDQNYCRQLPFDHSNTITHAQLLSPMFSSPDHISQPILYQQQQQHSQCISSSFPQPDGLGATFVPNTATNWSAHLNSFPQSFVDHVPMSSISMTENEQQQQQQPSPEKPEDRIYRNH